jgi:hypothetical protein
MSLAPRTAVIPAQAGIQIAAMRLDLTIELDSRVRGNDEVCWGKK